MKNFIALILLFNCLNINSQEGFRIGSTKEEVRVVQGKPNSISADWQGNTIWYFDDYEMARVTFSKNIVISYKNFQNVLRIAKKRKILSKQEKDFYDFIRDGLKKDTVKTLGDYNRERGYEVNYDSTGVKHIPDASKLFEKYGQNWSAIEGRDYSKDIKTNYEEGRFTIFKIVSLTVIIGLLFLLLYKRINNTRV